MTVRIVFTNGNHHHKVPGHDHCRRPNGDPIGPAVQLLGAIGGPSVGTVISAIVSDDTEFVTVTADVDDAAVEEILTEVGSRLISVDR